MLRVSLLGNLGAEPETRYTARGAQMTVFRVAVNQVRLGPEGERHENTEWFRVRVIGRQAEYAQRLTKGGRVFVNGRLAIGQYQSREGEARASYDVFADEVASLSGTRTRDVEPEPVAAGVARAGGSNGAEPAEELEDLPF